MTEQGKIDKIEDLLGDCITHSELLWDSEDTNPETSRRAGIMLWGKLKKINKNIGKIL